MKQLFPFVLTTLIPLTASAYPTSVVFTPTGEAKAGGQVGLLAYGSTNLSPSVSPGSSWFGTEVGLLPQWEYGKGLKFGGLEAGFDVISPYGPLVKPVVNAKLGLVTEGEWSPSVALGLMEVSPALPSMNYAYASATKGFFFGRFTLGFGANTGSRSQFVATFPLWDTRLAVMAAYESPAVAKRITFMLDHFGGSSEVGSTYAGCSLLLAEQTSLAAGAFLGNDRSNAYDGVFTYLLTSFDAIKLFRKDE